MIVPGFLKVSNRKGQIYNLSNLRFAQIAVNATSGDYRGAVQITALHRRAWLTRIKNNQRDRPAKTMSAFQLI